MTDLCLLSERKIEIRMQALNPNKIIFSPKIINPTNVFSEITNKMIFKYSNSQTDKSQNNVYTKFDRLARHKINGKLLLNMTET